MESMGSRLYETRSLALVVTRRLRLQGLLGFMVGREMVRFVVCGARVCSRSCYGAFIPPLVLVPLVVGKDLRVIALRLGHGK